MKFDIVVPCYNESEVIESTIIILEKFMTEVISKYNFSIDSKVIYVDDGSSDDTWQKIQLATEKLSVRGIKLSRNRGHQNALLAGIVASDADIVISIDADLQDDITAMYEMIEYAQKGIDVVYGVRKIRNSDSFLKNIQPNYFTS